MEVHNSILFKQHFSKMQNLQPSFSLSPSPTSNCQVIPDINQSVEGTNPIKNINFGQNDLCATNPKLFRMPILAAYFDGSADSPLQNLELVMKKLNPLIESKEGYLVHDRFSREQEKKFQNPLKQILYNFMIQEINFITGNLIYISIYLKVKNCYQIHLKNSYGIYLCSVFNIVKENNLSILCSLIKSFSSKRFVYCVMSEKETKQMGLRIYQNLLTLGVETIIFKDFLNKTPVVLQATNQLIYLSDQSLNSGLQQILNNYKKVDLQEEELLSCIDIDWKQEDCLRLMSNKIVNLLLITYGDKVNKGNIRIQKNRILQYLSKGVQKSENNKLTHQLRIRFEKDHRLMKFKTCKFCKVCQLKSKLTSESGKTPKSKYGCQNCTRIFKKPIFVCVLCFHEFHLNVQTYMRNQSLRDFYQSYKVPSAIDTASNENQIKLDQEFKIAKMETRSKKETQQNRELSTMNLPILFQPIEINPMIIWSTPHTAHFNPQFNLHLNPQFNRFYNQY